MVAQVDSTLHTWLKQQPLYAEMNTWNGGVCFGLMETLRCIAGNHFHRKIRQQEVSLVMWI